MSILRQCRTLPCWLTWPGYLQICQVFDAAECCRNTHQDPAWRQEAQEACIKLGGTDFHLICIWSVLQLPGHSSSVPK